MYKDIGGYDMRYVEFKQMCRTAWSQKLNYLRIDMNKIRDKGKYRFFKESKDTYVERICESEAF